jgi:hypothetical protein
LQSGVHPKNTLTYFEKQMGGRGGKLPPGQWEAIASENGWGPQSVISRDELVKTIDQRTPSLEKRRFIDEPSDFGGSAFDPGKGHGEAAYNAYTSEIPGASNYMETAVGYPPDFSQAGSPFRAPADLGIPISTIPTLRAGTARRM